MNEDNCVLSKYEMDVIEESLKYIRKQCGKHEGTLETLFQKITKLNDMAKQAKDKINHNDYIRHDTAPF